MMLRNKNIKTEVSKNDNSPLAFKTILQKLNLVKDLFLNRDKPNASSLKNSEIQSERRDYGLGIRLWNDKDPRVDQSFFTGGVPGFVLSQDQRIIDWNIAFEISFGELPHLRRGMKVADWYKDLDNFRRIPNREEQLYGEAVVPITDRDRVVFISSKFGRMVFMKLMSPILDRVSGRIIGWNISLNVNSVTERVKYFEELHARIQEQSKHARFVVGSTQLHAVSPDYRNFVEDIADQLSGKRRILILGAIKAEGLVTSLIQRNDSATVSVVDLDSDALRNLKTACGSFSKRMKLIRRSIFDSCSDSIEKFDAIVLYFPRVNTEELSSLLSTLSVSMSSDAVLILAGYNKQDGARLWWNENRQDLEKAGKIDVLKWHLNSVEDRDQNIYADAVKVPGLSHKAEQLAQKVGFEILGENFRPLKGHVSVLTLLPNRTQSITVKAI